MNVMSELEANYMSITIEAEMRKEMNSDGDASKDSTSRF